MTGVGGVEVGGKVIVGTSVGASVGTTARLARVGRGSRLGEPPQAIPKRVRQRKKNSSAAAAGCFFVGGK